MFSTNPLQAFFQKVFIHQKLNNWVGALIAVLIATAFGFLLSSDIILGVSVFAIVIGIVVLTICLVNPEFGLYIIMLYGFSASGLSRYLLKDALPVGVVMDILVFITFLGLFFSNENLKKNTDNFFKTPPAIYYTIIVVYLTLELFNPMAHSFEGWLQVMRKVFESFVIVFIAYNIFNRVSKIKKFLKVLFFFSFVTALYGCFQQWHGLLSVEINWVNADPLRLGLISIFGEYRKFSFLGGPTEFGVVMATCSLLYIFISFNEKKIFTKCLYIAGSIIMLIGMSYSGTRTANAMLVGGVIIFLLLTIDKKSTQLFACIAVLAFLFAMYAPIYSSASLLRFRSTFSAKEDASFNVREINRKSIQPFIWKHPFGGGLSTTGDMGKKYNPGHPVAGFPTDSSYLNKALESGWVGLILTLILYFVILQYIIRGYFLTKNKNYKAMFAALLAFFFAYFLGEMAQEVVGVFTNMVIFFPVFAIALRLRQFAEQELSNSAS